ncbi:MAG: hypothetical protein J6W42_00780 [Bacteroidaceae bacterium]|nr:hypothetical protein [Bacteroidaceae bacterium]
MSVTQTFKSFARLCGYNMRIIFSGKFIWFLLVGLALFFFLMFAAASRGTELSHEMVYGQLIIPGILLVFYPSCFGIQNDADHRILELLFGIPNYMYKVWLFRLVMIYVEVYLILVVYAFLARILLYPVQPFSMALNLMLPVILFGNLAFLYSTLIRNGNAAAVLSVLTVILALVLGNLPLVENKVWDVTINPYEEPENINAAIWSVILLKNRIMMIVAAIVFLMSGLLGLQNRGKFLG